MHRSLPANKVLVTVGTPCTVSAVGSTATAEANLNGSDDLVLLSAFDAGLVTLNYTDTGLAATWPDGTPAGIDDITAKHGTHLATNRGIRAIPALVEQQAQCDVAASLPHDFATGGLRRLSGLTYSAIRSSELKAMHGLFDDDPALAPSVQAQLYAYTGIGALASLPTPLHQVVPHPGDFRVVSGATFPGPDAWGEMGMPSPELRNDKFAARLAASLASHGTALVSTMLAPSFPLSHTRKNPEMLQHLRSTRGYLRVPQAPMNGVGACASSLIALADAAPAMLADYPGMRGPKMLLWCSADSSTVPDWRVLDGFGPGALVTRAKLDALNEGRHGDAIRPVGRSLAPFDADAIGTVVGDGGSGLIVTTLDVALTNFLDITSIIVGWGQSGETGGKAHFAGVGFGGENALVQALDIARQAHGYGVADFGYLAAHATGTRTNSRTDLTSVATARELAAEMGGAAGVDLPTLSVGTPKALGDGHTMGDAGMKAVAQAIRYVIGDDAVGLPHLQQIDPDLGDVATQYRLQRDLVPGDADGGAICATQGFGGYDGAVALRAANADSLGRYNVDQAQLDAYLERWPEIRATRIANEQRSRTTQGATLDLALTHRWPTIA